MVECCDRMQAGGVVLVRWLIGYFGYGESFQQLSLIHCTCVVMFVSYYRHSLSTGT